MKPENQLRLLVCDPDPQAQKMIREFLQDSSIRVFYTSPSEPFEHTLSSHSPFHAIVIDLSNPRRKACDALLEAVRKVSPNAQVIFMSRLADEMMWSQVLAMGAYDLLPKPPERQEFLRTVFGAVQKVQAA
jgi:two-component system, NtrC family, nitrogen regulation response regulator NtrX